MFHAISIRQERCAHVVLSGNKTSRSDSGRVRCSERGHSGAGRGDEGMWAAPVSASALEAPRAPPMAAPGDLAGAAAAAAVPAAGAVLPSHPRATARHLAAAAFGTLCTPAAELGRQLLEWVLRRKAAPPAAGGCGLAAYRHTWMPAGAEWRN